MNTLTRSDRRWHPIVAGRSLTAQHPALRFVQILPVALLLWGLDDVARFRTGAATAGLQHAVIVNALSGPLGGEYGHVMNDWTVLHHAAALAAAWYYILFQGAITGVVGIVLLWRQAPTFRLHRNALIAMTLVGLVAFWMYPVAPPRMLPGYHDVIAIAVPAFTSVVETNGAAQYASLPSLHVAWAIWVAIAACAVVRRPILRAAVWVYPVATTADVLATANHYLLDVITAPAIVLLGYGLVLTPALIGRRAHRSSAPLPDPDPPPVRADATTGRPGRHRRSGGARPGPPGGARPGRPGGGRPGRPGCAGCGHPPGAAKIRPCRLPRSPIICPAAFRPSRRTAGAASTRPRAPMRHTRVPWQAAPSTSSSTCGAPPTEN